MSAASNLPVGPDDEAIVADCIVALKSVAAMHGSYCNDGDLERLGTFAGLDLSGYAPYDLSRTQWT